MIYEEVLATLPSRTNDELGALLSEAKAILETPVDLSVDRAELLNMVAEAVGMIKAVHAVLRVRQGIAGWHADASAAVH